MVHAARACLKLAKEAGQLRIGAAALLCILVASGAGYGASDSVNQKSINQIKNYLANTPTLQPNYMRLGIIPEEKYFENNLADSAAFFGTYCGADNETAKIMCRAFISGYAQAWLTAESIRRPQRDFRSCFKNVTYDEILERLLRYREGTMFAETPPLVLIGDTLGAIGTDNGCPYFE